MRANESRRLGMLGAIARVILVILVMLGLNVTLDTNAEVAALQSGVAFAEDKAEDGKILFFDGREYYEYSLDELRLEKYQNYDTDSIFYEYTRCTDPTTLSYQLFCLTKKANRIPQDAHYYLDEQGNLQIQAEQTGQEVDLAKLIATLGNPFLYQPLYTLPMKKIEPQITKTELEQRKPSFLWAEYTTKLADNRDRTENVRIAGLKLHGLIVKPGEEISFNKIVGPRLPERGYREAKIIVAGKFEDGLGGGVCQVSSTLYNALLLAGLEMVERHNHSIPISYVPLGRDATVVYGQKDLIFRNTTDSHLLLRTEQAGLDLKISVFGGATNVCQNVRIENRIIRTYSPSEIAVADPLLKIGERKILQKGQKGYLVETRRIMASCGQDKVELLARDYYEPIKQVTAVNPEQLPPTNGKANH